MIELTLAPDHVRPEQGLCWTLDLPPEVSLGDNLDNPARSDLQLFEDGRPLGPAHADHSRIRLVGGEPYSHWKRCLYFSTSDNAPPVASGRRYWVRTTKGPASRDTEFSERGRSLLESLAPELRRVGKSMSLDMLATFPGSVEQRVEMLESKVEYLLDELYSAKSLLRYLAPMAEVLAKVQKYQISTFDFQWGRLPYHDAFLSNPEWRDKAADDLCARLDRPREWLRGKKVLDCGCGPGRHCWAFATLGALVTAFDTSPIAVQAARRETQNFAGVTIEQRNILDSLPYPPSLTWFGVME